MMLLYASFPLLVGSMLFFLYLMINWQSDMTNSEKGSAFECGFDPMCTPRKPFSLRFFMLIILFLIFDVEIVLLFPVLTLMKVSLYASISSALLFFLMILLLGLLYEWYMGALDWK
uniref:NADH-ubiquinone oxidoreductase chain 3 n=1 Tax=Orcula dolium TaxID=1331962 RepID=A0A1W5ICD5_9EUPU|nr:NADH dehydrogenase subunit 3 [Orcula dolium]AIR76274.1 NADH dehydrogenase subunit 3 [Orcula dolium]